MRIRSLIPLLLLLTLSGCGKMGDPMPPPRFVPAATKDLQAEQRGGEITLTFSHPKSTADGGALPGLEAVELWQIVQVLEEEQSPVALDAREFEGAATRVLELRGAELDGAISGDRILVRHVLEPSEERRGLLLAIRTVAATGERSDLSNQVALVPMEAPAPPATMSVTSESDAVVLAWESSAEDLQGFHVYRRLAQSRQYGAPLALVEPEERSYRDETASYGERYIYALRSVASKQPLVESATAIEREIHYLDRFAPPAPEGLLALAEEGRVRLRWRASPAADVVGYVLYRADPEGDFRRLMEEPLDGTEFLDTGLVSGLVYRYRLQAVDDVGNESPLGEILEARPR